jgi:prevent-host-death family protein
MQRIGVRELRQNASRYLAQVSRGESIEITQHGRPIARLVPIASDSWAELIASGSIIPPTEPGEPGEEEPLQLSYSAAAELQAMRDLERW